MKYKARIQDVPVMQRFPTPLRDQVSEIISGIGTPRVLKKGETLYYEGAAEPNTGAVLIDGELIIVYGAHPPFEVVAPELLGEMQQFNKFGTRTATVSAKELSTVLEFEWHEFVARVKDRPGIGHADHATILETLRDCARGRFRER